MTGPGEVRVKLVTYAPSLRVHGLVSRASSGTRVRRVGLERAWESLSMSVQWGTR
ncbi:hypothetical protein FHU38_000442 [Saccharomonospora amisosensis]|uniref:Uncharacterized protein n=1 Tax=Saccharomonospora amisosensis TaxID=1128677 RepID=A0A7X5ULA8_9PSEU|nr:hypothetical protein [Saccharomonospora amisosensis]